MKWASSIAEGQELRPLVEQCAHEISKKLGPCIPDLVIFFVTPHFGHAYEKVHMLVQELLPGGTIIGCSAGGIIAGSTEIEQRPSLGITAAVLPDVEINAFHAAMVDHPDPDAPPEQWRSWLGLEDFEGGPMVLLVDPFSAASEQFLSGFDYAFAGGPVIGGLASGAVKARGNVLFLNGELYHEGLVGLALSGNIEVDTLVAQGCRPIGAPSTITLAEKNLVYELDGRPTMDVLKDVLERLNDADRKLARSALFLGLEVDPLLADAYSGSFLIRNLVGIDYNTGALAVGAFIDEGGLVQFHLRDAEASRKDLEARLKSYHDKGLPEDACGALLFSCFGRGKFLYGEEGHDARLFSSSMKNCPLGGFFCNGEIGPIGSSTYLHGYTSSFGLFRPRVSA